MCLQPLRAEEQVLDQAQEENAARTQLKILGNSRDKLLSTVQSMENPMLDDKSCSQKTAQTLMGSQDLELASKTYEIMLEALDAAQKSTSNLRKMQQAANPLWSALEARSIYRGHQSALRQAQRMSSNLGKVPAAAEGNLVEA